MAKKRKVKLNEKQKKTIAKMKETRQIDSNKLRLIIEEKKKWTINEIKRGQQQMQNLRNTMYKLEGILAFINDLIEPIKEEKK